MIKSPHVRSMARWPIALTLSALLGSTVVGCTDKESLEGFHEVTRKEGIIPALESAHAVAYALKLAKTMTPEQSIIVNMSGRGDKDLHSVMKAEGIEL